MVTSLNEYQTKREWIASLSNEKLANCLYERGAGCSFCIESDPSGGPSEGCADNSKEDCVSCILEWLESKVKVSGCMMFNKLGYKRYDNLVYGKKFTNPDTFNEITIFKPTDTTGISYRKNYGPITMEEHQAIDRVIDEMQIENLFDKRDKQNSEKSIGRS